MVENHLVVELFFKLYYYLGKAYYKALDKGALLKRIMKTTILAPIFWYTTTYAVISFLIGDNEKGLEAALSTYPSIVALGSIPISIAYATANYLQDSPEEREEGLEWEI